MSGLHHQTHRLSQPPGMLAGMYSHSTPANLARHACWHCTSFKGLVYSGTAAKCAQGGAVSIQASPASGCAFWIREVGSDDEPGPPGGRPAIGSLVSADQPPAEVFWSP